MKAAALDGRIWCDTCTHFRKWPEPEPCGAGHAPRFRTPDMEDTMRGTFGYWIKDCDHFADANKMVET